jgi:hypothetical protein
VAALFAVLIHYPVIDRNGRIVASAITSLDIHDLARAARTYNASAVFVVHPMTDQREFGLRVIEHWKDGNGRRFDTRRREALELVSLVADLDEAIVAADRIAGARPLLVHTSARTEGGISYADLRARMERDDCPPVMLLFGTGFGMAPAMLKRADLALAPILGPGAYNHLSVRAAAGIVLDRLRGR